MEGQRWMAPLQTSDIHLDDLISVVPSLNDSRAHQDPSLDCRETYSGKMMCLRHLLIYVLLLPVPVRFLLAHSLVADHNLPSRLHPLLLLTDSLLAHRIAYFFLIRPRPPSSSLSLSPPSFGLFDRAGTVSPWYVQYLPPPLSLLSHSRLWLHIHPPLLFLIVSVWVRHADVFAVLDPLPIHLPLLPIREPADHSLPHVLPPSAIIHVLTRLDECHPPSLSSYPRQTVVQLEQRAPARSHPRRLSRNRQARIWRRCRCTGPRDRQCTSGRGSAEEMVRHVPPETSISASANNHDILAAHHPGTCTEQASRWVFRFAVSRDGARFGLRVEEERGRDGMGG